MSIEEKICLLAKFDLLSDLDNKSRMSITKYFQYKTIPKQTIFISERSIEDEMYFIVTGLVRIYLLHENGKEMTVAMRIPGEIVGEMSLIDDEPRSANAETIQDSSVFVLTKKNFLILIQKHPSIGLKILKTLSLRLRENLRFQEMSAFQTLKDRTLLVLQSLSSYYSDTDICLSHEQLSALINATQPRVTEALHSLQENQKISISRKNIHIN